MTEPLEQPDAVKPRRGKTISTAGAAAFGVAAVTAAALLLPGAFAHADSGDSGKTDPAVDQPEYPLPDLPPLEDNQTYSWENDLTEGKDSKPAGEYGAAFYDWFDSSDAKLKQQPPVQVFDNQIYLNTDKGDGSIEGEPTGESAPLYSVSAAEYDNDWTGWPELEVPGRDMIDTVGMEVWPNGGFKEGSGETFEYLANCEDTEDQADGMTLVNKKTCTESEGPGGEKILVIETVRAEKESGDVYSKHNDAIVYRTDGTAVKVSDRIPGPEQTDYPLDPKIDPYFDTEKLTNLALAMPDAIVEEK